MSWFHVCTFRRPWVWSPVGSLLICLVFFTRIQALFLFTSFVPNYPVVWKLCSNGFCLFRWWTRWTLPRRDCLLGNAVFFFLYFFLHCCLLYILVLFFFLSFFASVLLRWLRCCSSVRQPSHFWGIPWVWRGASIRFSPNLFKPSGLDGRQSVRRGHGSSQRRRIWVSQRGARVWESNLLALQLLLCLVTSPAGERL